MRNLNSDHAAQRFSVDLPDGTSITNVGFHDIDSTPASPTRRPTGRPGRGPTGTVSWATEAFATNRTPTLCAGRRCSTSGSTPTPRRRRRSTRSTSSSRVPPAVADAGAGVGHLRRRSAQIGTAARRRPDLLLDPGRRHHGASRRLAGGDDDLHGHRDQHCCDRQDTVTVTVEHAPAAPVLVLPADGATGLQPTVELSWNASAGAADYTVELATDAAFTRTCRARPPRPPRRPSAAQPCPALLAGDRQRHLHRISVGGLRLHGDQRALHRWLRVERLLRLEPGSPLSPDRSTPV